MDVEGNLLPLFSTPIYHVEDSGHTFTPDEIRCIKNLKLKSNLGGPNELSNKTFVLNDGRLKFLKETCQYHLDTFTKQVLKIKQDFYITNSWITKTEKGSYHQIHSHQNCIFSGVIYVNTTPDMGNLYFYGKQGFLNDFNFEYEYEDYNIYNTPSWNIPVKTGTIIIFPSGVKHGTSENTIDETRYVVGFNAFVCGDFGKHKGANYCSELTL
jgi:hypothetical protein